RVHIHIETRVTTDLYVASAGKVPAADVVVQALDPAQLPCVGVIDAHAFGDDEELYSDLDELGRVLDRFPDAVRLLVQDGQEPIGYMSWYPIADQANELLRAGLEPGGLVRFPKPQEALSVSNFEPARAFVLYVDTVALVPWANPNGVLQLLETFSGWVHQHANRIREIVTITATRQGRRRVRIGGGLLGDCGFLPAERVWSRERDSEGKEPYECWVARKGQGSSGSP